MGGNQSTRLPPGDLFDRGPTDERRGGVWSDDDYHEPERGTDVHHPVSRPERRTGRDSAVRAADYRPSAHTGGTAAESRRSADSPSSGETMTDTSKNRIRWIRRKIADAQQALEHHDFPTAKYELSTAAAFILALMDAEEIV